MRITCKPFWRSTAWPVLFFSTLYFLLYPDWHSVFANATARHEPTAISDPLNTLLPKYKANRPGEEAGRVAVNGSVISAAFDLNAVRDDALPIERELPASRPFWKPAYKPHAGEPRIESTAIPDDFFTGNFRTSEANRTEIAHGFGQNAGSKRHGI